jgi:hypothetical protein
MMYGSNHQPQTNKIAIYYVVACYRPHVMHLNLAGQDRQIRSASAARRRSKTIQSRS